MIPEQTKEVMTEDGYFRSGDLGYMKKGYLYICGRLKNVIIGPSGENIYPENIESEINSYAFVEESVVYQDSKQRIVAKIVLNYDELKSSHPQMKENSTNLSSIITNHLKELKFTVNSRVSNFSKIKDVIEHPEPFEKTPKKSIKRYLYTK